ncbi:MAG: hypothetical protein C0599_11790, partial [Salinivirgaceae bacterium]
LFTIWKTKLFKIDLIAVGIVISGLCFLTYDFETKINQVDLITLITAISLAFHIVFAQQFVKKTDAAMIVTYQFFAAMVVSFIAFKFTDNSEFIINPKGWYSLIYLGLIGTLVCYFITVWVQKYVPAIRVSIILATEPLFAALCSYLFINEKLTSREFLGATLILAGVMLHSWVKHKTTTRLHKKTATESNIQ